MILKNVSLSKLVLGSAVVSIATVCSTDLPARDKSSKGASVSADPGRASARAGNTTASADRGDAAVGSKGGRKARAVPAAASGGPVGDRSYDSVGDWFDDLRSLFSGERKGAEVVTEEVEQQTTHSSATSTTEPSDSGGTQVNRVIQRQSSTETSTAIATEGVSASAEAEASSTEIATEGASASAEAESSNVSEIQQKN
jgi:hypothetical protein